MDKAPPISKHLVLSNCIFHVLMKCGVRHDFDEYFLRYLKARTMYIRWWWYLLCTRL